jgi:adenylylsulfate kinase-like enzyme
MAVAGVPVVVITGPVGVGKTTVAYEVSALLGRAAVAHALVDLDGLRSCYPAPAGDRFNTALGLRNLAVVWANFRAAGAGRLILVDVVESRDQLDEYRTAVPGAAIVVVRLRAAVGALAERVRRREAGAGLDWHLDRAAELAAQMERDRVEDLVVETDERAAVEVAREVMERIGWWDSPPD